MIRLEGVTRRYQSRAGERVALDAVDLHIERGQIFGVVGRSGAGKSTLIRTINRLETPDEGRVVVAGEDITALDAKGLLKARRRIGMIFQHFNLLNSRTIEANVAFPLELEGRPKAEIKARVAELLERLGLAEHAKKYPSQLSGGQKQRVGIARALACDPQVLLCDEATSALDPETTEDILNLLDQLNRELGLTIVMITHQMEVVRRVCDRVAVLKDGKIVEEGPTADVFLNPKHPVTQAMLAEDDEGYDVEVAPIGGQMARLTFRGSSTYEPELSRVAREVGVDYSILTGRISRIRGEPCGQLLVVFTGGDAQAAMSRLSEKGIDVEAVNNGEVR